MYKFTNFMFFIILLGHVLSAYIAPMGPTAPVPFMPYPYPPIVPMPPLPPIEPGLMTNDSVPVPLKSIDITADVYGFFADVATTLEYTNEEDNPLEIKFVFPLDDTAALYYLESKCTHTIVAKIEEKHKAKQDYDAAIEAGKEASLLTEDDSHSDVLELKLGNIAPGQTCSVKFSFILELEVQTSSPSLKFTYPIILGERFSETGSDVTNETPKVQADSVPYVFNFELTVKEPETAVIKPGGTLQYDVNNNVATLLSGQRMTKNFVLYIEHEPPLQPYAVIETGVDKQPLTEPFGENVNYDQFLDETVIMVNFLPDLTNGPSLNLEQEYILIVDRSGSMSGNRIAKAKEALQEFLKGLPKDAEGCMFNIISFGSNYEFMFQNSAPCSEPNLFQASVQVETFDADFGGTRIYEPLDALFGQSLAYEQRQIFVISDGQVENTREVIDLVEQNQQANRIFSFGIGEGASTELIHGIASFNGHAKMLSDNDDLAHEVEKALIASQSAYYWDLELTFSLVHGLDTKITSMDHSIMPGEAFQVFTLLRGPITISGTSNTYDIGTATLTAKTYGERKGSKNQPDVEEITFVMDLVVDTTVQYETLPMHRMCAKKIISSIGRNLDDLYVDWEHTELSESGQQMEAISKASNVLSPVTSFIAIDEDTNVDGDPQSVTVPNIAEQWNSPAAVAFAAPMMPMPMAGGNAMAYSSATNSLIGGGYGSGGYMPKNLPAYDRSVITMSADAESAPIVPDLPTIPTNPVYCSYDVCTQGTIKVTFVAIECPGGVCTEELCCDPFPSSQDGGWTTSNPVSTETLEVWNQVLLTPDYADGLTAIDLEGLGTPVEVSTQVVAGTNYKFKFADGTEVTVWEQTWMNFLQITDVQQGPPVPNSPNGGWTTTNPVSTEILEVWNQVLLAPDYADGLTAIDLEGVGTPVGVSTQVVAGTNYKFKFVDGTEITVWEQTWMNFLQITDIQQGEPVAPCPPVLCYIYCETYLYDANGCQQCGCEYGKSQAGGWTPGSVDEETLEVWNKVLLTPDYADGLTAIDLEALGTPVGVTTQVVAGTNYKFKFLDETEITVWEQTWMDFLQITKVEAGPQNKGCTLEDGTSVPDGWTGKGTGSNICNSCRCSNGSSACTKMFCYPKVPKSNAGGWTTSSVDEESLEVWNNVLLTPDYADGLTAIDLEALGPPVAVSSQVVAGTNYKFKFADGTQVTVWEQTWMNFLQITKIEQGNQNPAPNTDPTGLLIPPRELYINQKCLDQPQGSILLLPDDAAVAECALQTMDEKLCSNLYFSDGSRCYCVTKKIGRSKCKPEDAIGWSVYKVTFPRIRGKDLPEKANMATKANAPEKRNNPILAESNPAMEAPTNESTALLLYSFLGSFTVSLLLLWYCFRRRQPGGDASKLENLNLDYIKCDEGLVV